MSGCSIFYEEEKALFELTCGDAFCRLYLCNYVANEINMRRCEIACPHRHCTDTIS